jgi:hypothetical protein
MMSALKIAKAFDPTIMIFRLCTLKEERAIRVAQLK